MCSSSHQWFSVQDGASSFVVMIDRKTGRFAGIVDAAGRTLRFDAWTDVDGVSLPARLTLGGGGGPETTFSYHGFEFNTTPQDLFTPPPDIAREIDRMRR